MIDFGTVTTVTVTQEHIDRGKRCHTGECPIALAILSLGLPDGYRIHVDITHAFASNGAGQYAYSAELPDAAAAFIERFDYADTDRPGPVEFQLSWTEEA